MSIALTLIFLGRIFGRLPQDNEASIMAIGDIDSVPETAYGFRTKLRLFIERIERLRRESKKEKKEIHILDVGCANGIQVTFPLGAQGYTVTGLDMHEPSIRFARENNHFHNVHFELQKTENIHAATGEKKFDVIILSDILEHVENPMKVLRDVHALLKLHGIVLISIPNGHGPFEVENYILRKLGIIWLGRAARGAWARVRRKSAVPYNVHSGHIQFFTRRSFQKVVEDAGFIISFFQKGCFLGGSISNAVISKIPFLLRTNIALGRYLPAFFCSVWYFECQASSSELANKQSRQLC